MGPLTSNQIFGFRTDVLLKLLNLLARKTYPTADEHQVNRLVPLLLQQLYEQMQKADTTVKLNYFFNVLYNINIFIILYEINTDVCQFVGITT